MFVNEFNTSYMRRLLRTLIVLLAALIVILLASGSMKLQMHDGKNDDSLLPGHYTYFHAFNYDLYGNHLDVHETGSMDFHSDGTALDSASQMYVATLKEGAHVTYVFNYVSPSRWSLDGTDLYFSGIKDKFRMELVDFTTEGCDSTRAIELAQQIIKVVSGSIDYEYKFHIDTLTDKKLQWSYTYRDGHTDTWKFYRGVVFEGVGNRE